MNYFSISFPNHTAMIVKVKSPSTLRGVVLALSESVGMVGYDGTIFNPTQFISVNSISSPDEKQKRLAKELDEVLF